MAPSTSFVLDDHRNVRVSLAGSNVQDLTKEELNEWAPFKVGGWICATGTLG